MWIRFAVDIISCMFEFNLNVFIPMKDDMWKRCEHVTIPYMVNICEHSCCELLGQLIETLQSNPDLELIPDLLELDENLTVS